MLARNERRRKVLAVLVGRMQSRQHVRSEAATDLIDVLFVLTSFPVFAELAQRGRDTAAACRLIQNLAASEIERAGAAKETG
jgi:hypothetical protein